MWSDPATATPQHPASECDPATIASKPPKKSSEYNEVLSVQQLRCKAKAAGIPPYYAMKKAQLLLALA